MIFFKEQDIKKIKRKLACFQSVGIISCGGCPAIQRIGGTVGIERWMKLLSNITDIRWSIIAPILCDERLLEVHLNELGEDLTEVDAVLTIACDAGNLAIDHIVGFPSISLLKTISFGLVRTTGEIHRVAHLREK